MSSSSSSSSSALLGLSSSERHFWNSALPGDCDLQQLQRWAAKSARDGAASTVVYALVRSLHCDRLYQLIALSHLDIAPVLWFYAPRSDEGGAGFRLPAHPQRLVPSLPRLLEEARRAWAALTPAQPQLVPCAAACLDAELSAPLRAPGGFPLALGECPFTQDCGFDAFLSSAAQVRAKLQKHGAEDLHVLFREPHSGHVFCLFKRDPTCVGVLKTRARGFRLRRVFARKRDSAAATPTAATARMPYCATRFAFNSWMQRLYGSFPLGSDFGYRRSEEREAQEAAAWATVSAADASLLATDAQALSRVRDALEQRAGSGAVYLARPQSADRAAWRLWAGVRVGQEKRLFVLDVSRQHADCGSEARWRLQALQVLPALATEHASTTSTTPSMRALPLPARCTGECLRDLVHMACAKELSAKDVVNLFARSAQS